MCELKVRGREWVDDRPFQQPIPSPIPRPEPKRVVISAPRVGPRFSTLCKGHLLLRVCPACPQFLELTLGLGEALVPVLIP